MTIKILTPTEKKKLKKVCAEIEIKVYYREGWKHLSGGFARCEVNDYDDETVELEVKHGIQNDCEDRTYRYTMCVDRKTMEITNEEL
jgi:hypothetical protein